MRRALHLASICLSLLIIASDVNAFDERRTPLLGQGTLQSAFAPWDDVEGLIVEVLNDAKTKVRVQAYLLTSNTIALALITAHQRGVDVKVLVDADQLNKNDFSKVPELFSAGIPVWLETKYQNAHNKTILVDPETPEATVITGSYNFTWSAQHKNAENILIVRKNQPLAAQYLANWERHQQDATPYKT